MQHRKPYEELNRRMTAVNNIQELDQEFGQRLCGFLDDMESPVDTMPVNELAVVLRVLVTLSNRNIHGGWRSQTDRDRDLTLLQSGFELGNAYAQVKRQIESGPT